MKIITKATISPEAWARRMEIQRKRRAKPEVREALRARARELWPTSKKKAGAREYQKRRRAQGHCAEADKRRRERMAADPALKRKRLDSSKAAYYKKREYYLRHVAGHRERVSPSYAASVLRAPVATLTPEIVELVRAHLTLKRELRTK